MKKLLFAAVSLMATTTPALAQEEGTSAFTASGSVGMVTDYRFRGVSQTNEKAAIQGGLTVSHESGLYVGTWGSNLAGWGQFGGSNMELDLIAGYKRAITDAITVDVGVTYYMYPGGSDITDFFEPYVKVSSSIGPVNGTLGVAYAPSQEALGNWSGHPDSRIGDKEDNFYIWGDVSGGIPNTPVTLKAHLGYSDGNPGLGPNGTSIAPTGKFIDYMVGADLLVLGKITLGVSYVGTDIEKRNYLRPLGFANTIDGSSISTGRVIGSISASF